MKKFIKKLLSKEFKHKTYLTLEHLIDKLITPAVLILLVIIVIELGFPDIAHNYDYIMDVFDNIIIGIFFVDLIFKYNHVKNWKKFLKFFWLDIIAIFPFFLLFRAFEGLSSLFQIGETTQSLLHEGLELEKEGSKLVTQVEKATKISSKSSTLKFSKITRIIKPLLRLPRILKIISRIRWHKKKYEISIILNKKLLKEFLKKKSKKRKKN